MTVAQLLKSSTVRSLVNNDLIDRDGGAVVIMSVEHRMPATTVKFLRLSEKLNSLHNTLLDSNIDLQIVRSKPKKSALETKMREDL